MLRNISDAFHYSEIYDVPVTDVSLIALNTWGAQSFLNFLRIRSYFIPKFENKRFYLMICLNTSPTTFTLKNSEVYLGNEKIGKLIKWENDLAELCYFRKKNRVLVLNTNDRTRCIGKCKFCGAVYQKARYPKKKFLNFEELLQLFNKIEKISKTKFSKLENITLCTGLFESEEKVVNHLIAIWKAANLLGFEGEIKYIGTQIQKAKSLNKISKAIPNFSYYYALETLERRELVDIRKNLMHRNFSRAINFLRKLRKYNFEVSVLYVLGLDPLSSVEKAFKIIKNNITRFPVINLFQAYHPSQELLRHPEARTLDYFLKARKIFEKIFISYF